MLLQLLKHLRDFSSRSFLSFRSVDSTWQYAFYINQPMIYRGAILTQVSMAGQRYKK